LSREQEREKNSLAYEAQLLGPHNQWFDPIGIRFISNMTERPLKIGFTHNIFEVTEEDLKTEKVKALKGKIIEED
jgi:hypothetical protein